MKHKISRELFEYWNRRRQGSNVPDRSAIEPYDLGRKLVDTFLLQFDAKGEPLLRFCGSNLANRYGRDMTGENFLLPWPAEERKEVEHNLKMMVQSGLGFVAGFAAETAGGGLINYELTVLPLRGTSEIDQAIGALVRVGGHEETNRVRDRIVAQTLRTVRVLEERDRAFLQPRDITHRLPPLPQPSQIRKHYGHLAVINGGK
jgi:hypothetical protein